MIAAQRRRELLEYKHRFGFPASPSPFDLHRARNGGEAPLYPRPSHSNTAIYDDPRFWALSEEDQQLLEGMEWWEQQRLGFGLYGESGEDGLGEEWTGHEVDEEGRRIGEPKYDPLKMRDTFHCRMCSIDISLGSTLTLHRSQSPPKQVPSFFPSLIDTLLTYSVHLQPLACRSFARSAPSTLQFQPLRHHPTLSSRPRSASL